MWEMSFWPRKGDGGAETDGVLHPGVVCRYMVGLVGDEGDFGGEYGYSLVILGLYKKMFVDTGGLVDEH